MPECFEPSVFSRHKRSLRAVMIESQAWLCLRDMGRLMGVGMEERKVLKLNPDQRRTVWLKGDGQWEKCALVSESGVYAMLIHHYIPENRALRQWLTYEVLPILRLAPQTQPSHLPEPGFMEWQGVRLSLLHWQSELWMRLRDLPEFSSSPVTADEPKHGAYWLRAWQRVLG